MKFDTIVKIIRLGRFQFVFGGFLFFCAGALLALLLNAEFTLDKFIAGYGALFTAHLAVSYSNDYFDIEVDKFGKPTRFSGGSGVLIDNPELKNFSKRFSLVLMGLSMAIATVSTVIFDLPISFWLLILFGNLLGWYYSAPPLKLSYRGFSELATVLTGFIVPGVGYVVLMGKLDLYFFIFSLSLMMYELFFIINVEIPDMEIDKKGGKKTLVVNHGLKTGFIIVAGAAFLATSSYIFISQTDIYPSYINFGMITLISLVPLIVGTLVAMKKSINLKNATALVNYNLISLSLFIILVNAYLLYQLQIIH